MTNATDTQKDPNIDGLRRDVRHLTDAVESLEALVWTFIFTAICYAIVKR